MLLPLLLAAACHAGEGIPASPDTEVRLTIERTGSVPLPRKVADTALLPLSILGGGEGTFAWTGGAISDHPHYVRHLVTFLSSVDTGDPVNDTVRAEYFLPKKGGRLSAVLLLHTFSGPGIPEHTLAHLLANSGRAVLLLQLPHFGMRAGGSLWAPLRLRTESPEEIRTFCVQAAADARMARQLLASLPEIDPRRIDVVGISLGSFIAVLAASPEPAAFRRQVLVLAGGPLEDVLWFSGIAKAWKDHAERSGLTHADVRQALAPVNVLAYAPRLDRRRVLMLSARNDRTIPANLMENLHVALDRPERKWYDTTHYTMMLEILPVTRAIMEYLAR